MVEVRYDPPRLAERDALAIARERFGLTAAAAPLPSERDQNFLLTSADGVRHVLKIARAAEARAELELQNAVLERLAARLPDVELPGVIRTPDGEDIVTFRAAGGREHLVRLLTYVPGRLLAEARPRSHSLLRSLGRALGLVDRALLEFEHPAARRDLKWDVARPGWVREYLPLLAPARRALVESALAGFEREVAPRLPALRRSVIANDANDHNVLVAEDGDPLEQRVAGLIDFGDMVETVTIAELAVAGAYAAMGTANPVGAIAELVRGYHAVLPLGEEELDVLLPLTTTRLAVSVTNSAYQKTVEPDNEYLTVSEAPAWRLLERLAGEPPALAVCRFREACGLEPCAKAPAIVRWLRASGPFGPVLDPDPRESRRVVFDLSVGSPELGPPDEWGDDAALTKLLLGRMAAERATVGIGRYDEPRAIYTSEVFRGDGDDAPERRTVHLGMDLFAEVGTPVLAPLDGVVVSVKDNAAPLDYGPTVILRHEVSDGPGSAGAEAPIVFFTLYGHLSRVSVAPLAAGDRVTRGERVGLIGAGEENGGWTPHVHFQIIADLLGKTGDFPGVAAASERRVWSSLALDPNLIVGLPAAELASPHASAEEVRTARREHLGPSLSLSYREPLEIVRGIGARLYDAGGRPYLDAVNNVAHVGHGHPRVVRAGQRQMAVLNTNTRYLHETIARYAERLRATLPQPLSVFFFVSSGSEANELALRLAHAHSGRKDVIVLDVAYHGNTSTLIDVSPYKHAGPGGAGAPAWVYTAPLPDAYRGAFRAGDPYAGIKYAAQVAKLADHAARTGDGIGAFLHESIPSCAGQVVLPDGYLAEAYRAVHTAGAVTIADEVQTGFGRVGSHFWAFETQGVVPDVVTMGKPIGNGHPLGAVATTPEVARSFANGMEYFSTFGGNPVSCAIGLAVLDVIAEERLQENARDVGAYLLERLRALMPAHPILGDVRGLGLFLGVELVRDRETLEPAGEEAGYVANRMKDRGVLVGTDGPFHNVLKIKPPLVFSRQDADALVDALDATLAEDFCRKRCPIASDRIAPR